MNIISQENITRAINAFKQLGLRVVFGEHVAATRLHDSSSPTRLRLADLHAAFADPSISGIFTVIGGFTIVPNRL